MHLLLSLVVCLLPLQTLSSSKRIPPHFQGQPGELCSATSCPCWKYNFCSDVEYKSYKKQLTKDIGNNKNLRNAWNKAKTRAKKDVHLTIEESTAIMAYTMDDIYKDFNNKTRTVFPNIASKKYPYKGLHFFLSSAVHKLSNYRSKQVFRCFKEPLSNYNKGDKFVYKQFASTTKNESTARGFGKYCFYITTVKGAEIQRLSYYESEEEILIPSCEVFTVVEFSAKKKILRLRSTTPPVSGQTRAKRSTDRQQYPGLTCGQKSQWKASWKIVILLTLVTFIQTG